MYSVNADPTLRLDLGRGFSRYVLAGGGYLRRTVEFTRPSRGPGGLLRPAVGTSGHRLRRSDQQFRRLCDEIMSLDEQCSEAMIGL